MDNGIGRMAVLEFRDRGYWGQGWVCGCVGGWLGGWLGG